jgi:DNA-binding response OmpR family regulator
VTGCGQEEDRRKSKEAGIDYHMTKPLAPNVLTSFVESPRSGLKK